MYYQTYLSYQHGTEHRVLFKAVFVAWGKSACRSLSKALSLSPLAAAGLVLQELALASRGSFRGFHDTN